jgi:hypothetical protein
MIPMLTAAPGAAALASIAEARLPVNIVTREAAFERMLHVKL